MSEKYLIDKASLTALADITRAYNETPDKEYTLAEVTEQVKKASENYYNLFENGISLLESETAKSINAYGFCGVMDSVTRGVINLPNVSEIGQYALMGNFIEGFNMPSTVNIKSYAFSKCKWYTPIYFPNLESIGSYAFQESAKAGSAAAYNLYCPKLKSLGTGAFNPGSIGTNYLILKTLPVLEGIPDWGSVRKMKILLASESYNNVDWENEANWNEVKNFVECATTYDENKQRYWKDFVSLGILTEEEIRRDYYGETVAEGGEV